MAENTEGDAKQAPQNEQENAPAKAQESRGRGGRRNERGDDNRGRGRGKGRRDRDRREPREPEFIDTLIDIYRCSATVKGGRRLSFAALVAVGDAKGRVAVGYGKAKEVPGAIQKAIKAGRTELKRYSIVEGGTISHQVKGRFGASTVVLVPAGPGTGVIAGPAVKAILEAAGFHNVLTKSLGSPNRKNLAKATINALEQLRSKEQVEALRGVAL